MSKKSRTKRLSDAFSLLAIEYLEKGDLALASRITTVANTLRADPQMMDRLAKILEELK